jgi:hypothetical protein
MRGRALLALLLAGCTATSPAPPTARRTIQQAQRDPHGAWINVTTSSGEVAGELLAVEREALVVESTRGFQRIPIASVRKVSLAWFEADNSGIIAWNLVGTLSTLSHGFFLVLTAPLLWWVPGSISARSASRQGYASAEAGELVKLHSFARFARFPGGLPPGFDPTVAPPEGGLDQPCYPNQTCNQGLTCDRGVCRPGAPR